MSSSVLFSPYESESVLKLIQKVRKYQIENERISNKLDEANGNVETLKNLVRNHAEEIQRLKKELVHSEESKKKLEYVLEKVTVEYHEEKIRSKAMSLRISESKAESEMLRRGLCWKNKENETLVKVLAHDVAQKIRKLKNI
jgi:hypothetical protein